MNMRMKTLNEFLDLYPKQNTKWGYQSSIFAFLEYVYGDIRNGNKATRDEIKRLHEIASRYLAEKRDYFDDLMKWSASLNSRPPKTGKSYLIAVKEWLAYNEIEFTQRQLKTIRLKLPKGNARTVEKDMDNTVIGKILQHTDLKGKALILTLASSGMRLGEALNITIDDVDLTVNPPIITVRGEYTKTGEQRFTFISKEGKETLAEWLKVRESYLKAAQNKNKGLILNGKAKLKSIDDNRLFPFSDQTAEQLWTTALTNAGLLSIDKSTNRKQLRIHQLRRFFRSQLALGCPVDIIEALMGHQGYLNGVYRQYSKAQMVESYLKFEHLLYIQMPKDIQKIESEFKDELNKNRKLIEDIILENRELKQEVGIMKKDIELTKEFMELMKTEPRLLDILKGLGEKKY